MPKINQQVTTKLDPSTKDWLEPEKRRDNVRGTIVSEHDSHGHCFMVRHNDDGVIAGYEPQELLPVEAT